MKYGERLKAAIDHAGITQQELVNRCKGAFSQAAVSYLIKSDATGSEFTAQFANACGVNAMWLAAEEGEMVDGLCKNDERIKHIAMVCESLPSYAVDQLVLQSDALAQLIQKAKSQ